MEEKKGWSWLGFLFAPYYYSGYGDLKKGLIFSALSGLIPVIGIVFNIYGGIKAKKELPIGKIDFSWKNVAISIVVYAFALILSQLLITSMMNATPNCTDVQTKEIVISLGKEELAKQGLSSIIPSLEFDVTNIRTTIDDKELDFYECSADFKMTSDIETKQLPITYTVESVDDGSNFSVNVYGF